jgi:hypothetical protein
MKRPLVHDSSGETWMGSYPGLGRFGRVTDACIDALSRAGAGAHGEPGERLSRTLS